MEENFMLNRLKIITIMVLMTSGLYAQRVSELPAADSTGTGDIFLLVQGGVTKKIPYDSLAKYLGNSSVSLWTLSGSDITNTNSGFVIADSLFKIWPLPPQATKVGRVAHINQYGQVEWMSPSILYDTMQRDVAAAPTVLTTWLRDDVKGAVYLADSTDKVGIGTDTPTEMLDVKGNINIPATAADESEGILKIDGVPILHTYHEQGDNNLFIGQNAGNFTLDSSFNIGIGKTALSALTTGYYNLGIGYEALKDNTSGWGNTAIGGRALYKNKANTHITAIGYLAMYFADDQAGGVNTGNTAIGYESLKGSVVAGNNTGKYNTAIGSSTLSVNTTGWGNSIIGNKSGNANTTGHNNTAVGYFSFKSNTTGLRNAAFGANALEDNTFGSYNTAIGQGAGGAITTGSGNVLLGYSAGSALTTESNKLYIANSSTATPLIGGDFSTDQVTINGDLTTTGDLTIGETAGYDTITANTITAEAVTIDWRKSNIQTLALSDTVTVTFTAPPNYCHLTLKIVHANNTTVFPITWPATVKWAGGTAVTPTATANAVDIVSFLYDGTNYYGMFGNDFK
jgi:hypothetical protein